MTNSIAIQKQKLGLSGASSASAGASSARASASGVGVKQFELTPQLLSTDDAMAKLTASHQLVAQRALLPSNAHVVGGTGS